MSDEDLGNRVTRLEQRMADFEKRMDRVFGTVTKMDERQWWILLALVGNFCGMAGTFVAVMLKGSS